MRITIAAIGKLKAGAERELFDRYVDRATASGRSLQLSFALKELAESRAATAPVRKEQEATAMLEAIPAGSVVVALDESGKSLDSRAFAEQIRLWRDDGNSDLAFCIGGPDGHGPGLLKTAGLRLAFGAMTWPHQLARLMLAEQLYRAITILIGHPYHRD